MAPLDQRIVDRDARVPSLEVHPAPRRLDVPVGSELAHQRLAAHERAVGLALPENHFFGRVRVAALLQVVSIDLGEVADDVQRDADLVVDAREEGLQAGKLLLEFSVVGRGDLKLEANPLDPESGHVEVVISGLDEDLASALGVAGGLPDHLSPRADDEAKIADGLVARRHVFAEDGDAGVEAVVTPMETSAEGDDAGLLGDKLGEDVVDGVGGAEVADALLPFRPHQADFRARHWDVVIACSTEDAADDLLLALLALVAVLARHPPVVPHPEELVRSARHKTALVEGAGAIVVPLGLFEVQVLLPVGKCIVREISGAEVRALDALFIVPALVVFGVAAVKHAYVVCIDGMAELSLLWITRGESGVEVGLSFCGGNQFVERTVRSSCTEAVELALVAMRRGAETAEEDTHDVLLKLHAVLVFDVFVEELIVREVVLALADRPLEETVTM